MFALRWKNVTLGKIGGPISIENHILLDFRVVSGPN